MIAADYAEKQQEKQITAALPVLHMTRHMSDSYFITFPAA